MENTVLFKFADANFQNLQYILRNSIHCLWTFILIRKVYAPKDTFRTQLFFHLVFILSTYLQGYVWYVRSEGYQMICTCFSFSGTYLCSRLLIRLLCYSVLQSCPPLNLSQLQRGKMNKYKVPTICKFKNKYKGLERNYKMDWQTPGIYNFEWFTKWWFSINYK